MSRVAELEAQVAGLSPRVESLWQDMEAAENQFKAKRWVWYDAKKKLESLQDELRIAKTVEERLVEAGVAP